MARLDATRVAAWRELQSVTAELERTVDEALRRRVGRPARLVRRARRRCSALGGSARPSDLAVELRLVALQPQPPPRPAGGGGLGERAATGPPEDQRAVIVELTRRGPARCGGR